MKKLLIYGLLVMVMISCVFGAVPVMQNITLEDLNVGLYDDLVYRWYANDTDADNLSYEINLYKNGILIINKTEIIESFQLQADRVELTKSASLPTLNLTNFTDGDYSTKIDLTPLAGIGDSTYTINSYYNISNFLSIGPTTELQIKDKGDPPLTLGFRNETLSDLNLVEADELLIRFSGSNVGITGSFNQYINQYFYIHNGVSKVIRTVSSGSTIFYIYEQSIFWKNKNHPHNTYVNLYNYSGDKVIGDNFTISVRAYDGSDYSAWMNYSYIIDQIFNITFRDEKTESIINTSTIYLELISDDYIYNYSTTTGLINIDLINGSNYTFRYYSNGYGLKRHYFYTFSGNYQTNLTFYLLNNSISSDTTVTVYDEMTLNSIENAIVYMQRYYGSNNEYKTVAMYQTDPSGSAFFDSEHNLERYKFIVDYPLNTRKLITSGYYIAVQQQNLYISLTDSALSSYFEQIGISSSLTYNNVTKTFSSTYSDNSGVATSYTLTLKTFESYGENIVNQTTSTNPSSTISVGGADQNKTYYVVFSANIGGNEQVIKAGWVEITEDSLNAGKYGLFLTIFIFMILVFLSSIHWLSVFLGSSALIFAKIFGLINIDWTAIMGVFIVSFVLAMIIEMKK